MSVYTRRVHYADTDAGGVMYHATYLVFAEAARTEALRDAGWPHQQMIAEHGVSFIVQTANIEYVRPAKLDDLVTVTTACLEVRPASARLLQCFHRDGTELARLNVRLGCVGVAHFRPQRIPAPWRHALDRMRPPQVPAQD